MIKKFLIIFYFLYITLSQNLLANIFIVTSVDDEIITNYDVIKEGEYLKILNPQLSQLEENQILELSKNSLIQEIIKKKEIMRFIDLDKNNTQYVNEYLDNLYRQLNFKSQEDLQKELSLRKTYNLEQVKEKVRMELFWNELVFSKYKNQINIDKEKLKKKVKNIVNKDQKEYLISEIIFNKKKDQEIKNLITQIKKSILEIGFDNTANIYSITGTAKFGGKVGWVNENNLPKNLLDKVKILSAGQYSEVIKINNNFLIIKVNEIRIAKAKVNKDKELEKLIQIEKDKQLNQFSKIYFDKLKINSKIDEK
jgi:peptidyl-prolyl cis-trans isomerase SurA